MNFLTTTRARWLAVALMLAVLVVWAAWGLQHGYQMHSIDYIALGIGLVVFGFVELWIARRSASLKLRSGARGGIAAGVCFVVVGIAVLAVHGVY